MYIPMVQIEYPVLTKTQVQQREPEVAHVIIKFSLIHIHTHLPVQAKRQ